MYMCNICVCIDKYTSCTHLWECSHVHTNTHVYVDTHTYTSTRHEYFAECTYMCTEHTRMSICEHVYM